VRRGLTWLAGAVGLAALLRHLSRRRQSVSAPPLPAPVADDPADALRQRLSEQRDEEQSTGEDEAGDEPVDLEERRARVHQLAQETIDTMRETEQPDDPNGGAVA